jgi:hypothetical protein
VLEVASDGSDDLAVLWSWIACAQMLQEGAGAGGSQRRMQAVSAGEAELTVALHEGACASLLVLLLLPQARTNPCVCQHAPRPV